MNSRFRLLLYIACVLTDFSAFIVIFAVTRGLAEAHAEPWFLGVVGAGFSLTAGIASVLGGWLTHRFDGRVVIVSGAATMSACIAACGMTNPASLAFLAEYWVLGIGLGFFYPPLIGWLNQGVDAHANRSGVSRTLILFCVSWNFGMMCGQLTAGSLFSVGPNWTYGVAFGVSLLNVLVVCLAARRVVTSVAVAVDRTPAEHQAVELATAFKRLSWIANLGGMFGGSMVLHLLPDLAVTIGVAAADHGKVLAVWRGVIIATYLVMYRLTFWHYNLTTALVSQVLAGIGLIVISQATSAGTLLIGLVLLGQLVGYNYFSGLFYSTVGSSHESRALAAGIHEATLAIGMAVGTIVGGVLGSLVNHRVPYLLAAVVLGVMIIAQTIAWWIWVYCGLQQRNSAAATGD